MATKNRFNDKENPRTIIKRAKGENDMEYIIIVGGQLHNKGAQAMAYTVVDAMKKKFPEKEVVLFASVYQIGTSRKDIF